MSAYTSLRVTRSKAKKEIEKWLISQDRYLVGNNDRALEDFMDWVLGPRLYNAVIVPDGEPNDDHLV